MSDNEAGLLNAHRLKEVAEAYASWQKSKIQGEQKGLSSLFDKWFTRIFTRLKGLDERLPWEDSLSAECARKPAEAKGLSWDFARLQLFLSRWDQGRFVNYRTRLATGRHYSPRFGMEFGSDVFLTAQGAPRLMQWRGIPLMKTVFDYAIYPMLLNDLSPLTIFEVGSGQGASAIWFADHLKLLGQGEVHSADINPPQLTAPHVTFHRGNCSNPSHLFPANLLTDCPHPWLVIEDAHENVEGVLSHFNRFMRKDDYLVVEDSEVKRDALLRFTEAHQQRYVVDTKYTDYFGRNATAAADAIFRLAE